MVPNPRVKLRTLALTLSAAALLTACPKPRPPGSGAAQDASAQVAQSPDAAIDPCADIPEQDRATVLAQVGSSRLTLCDFARRLATQNPYLRARLSTPESRRAMVRAWVDSEVLALEARTRGMDQEPSVRNAIYSQLARQIENEVRAGVTPPTVSEADVESYYREHQADYQSPAQVRFSQIVVSTRADADRVLAEAQRIARDDTAWRALVTRETRDEAGRSNGGDMGFVGRDGSTTVPREVAAAAFALNDVGQVAAQVVESQTGGPSHSHAFHVLRMVARRDALQRPLDDVRRAIRNRLFEQRNDDAQNLALRTLLERLRREQTVSIDERALQQVRIDAPPLGTPAAMPGRGVGQPMIPVGIAVPAAGAHP
jgi:hypothetical protein